MNLNLWVQINYIPECEKKNCRYNLRATGSEFEKSWKMGKMPDTLGKVLFCNMLGINPNRS